MKPVKLPINPTIGGAAQEENKYSFFKNPGVGLRNTNYLQIAGE